MAIGNDLDDADRVIDATGKYVLPGGIEAHCHIEQESSSGLMTSDDYYSGSVSAAFGGNTCIVPFAAQHRGQTLESVLELYHGRAEPKSVIDYSFHLILSDPTDDVLHRELPLAIEQGITSFKVYMTYDRLIVDDTQMLDILAVAKKHGALTMIHAENNAMIKWMSGRLLDSGHGAPEVSRAQSPSYRGVRGHQPGNCAGGIYRRADPDRARVNRSRCTHHREGALRRPQGIW